MLKLKPIEECKRERLLCPDWDSFDPQPIFDTKGRQVGIKMPRATQEELGYGIQSWSRPAVETRVRKPDLVVRNHGSIIMLVPGTAEGRQWIEEHVQVPDYSSSRSVPVEARYIEPIIDGAIADGLEVNVS